MSIETLQQVSDILTVNLLFHAALFGLLGGYGVYKARRCIQCLTLS